MADGVLLVGHGSVSDLDDIPAFLTRIRRGRPPTPELTTEVRRRYEHVGGSPFMRHTEAQRDALASAVGLPVFLGMNMWEPSVEDGIAEAAAAGVTRLCVLPLAPFSTHIYWAAATEAAERRSAAGLAVPELGSVAPWGGRPELLEAHVALIAPRLSEHEASETELVLSAHSLPIVAIERGDPYQDQFETMARRVFQALGYDGTIAYQSQGMGGGAWLGPTVEETLERTKARGRSRVVWAPAGFLADHVETLYDLDVEAAECAARLGLDWVRVPALNTSPGLIRAMAGAVREALGETT